MKINKKNLVYALIYLCFTILVLATAHFPFFWDTLQLASKHAYYFYDTNFSSIILPNDIDSGHIPSLGIYLALVWKICGKSLIVSHLVMLPFVWGIVYQSIQLTKRLFTEGWSMAALLLLLADATLLAQSTLVSPDVLLVFFFMMALNHFYSHKKVWFAIALAGLALASMRGMMCVAALFIAHLIIKSIAKPNNGSFGAKLKSVISSAFSILPLYLPAIVIVFSFLAWHYYKTGWIGYHKNMPWYPLFEIVDFKGAIRNVFILGWRLNDFGHLFVWLAGILCVWHFVKKRPLLNDTFRNLAILYICLLLALGQAVVLHKGLAGHRYLLPLYLLFSLIVSYYVFHYVTSCKTKKVFFAALLIGLLSGNCWVYPDKIAKGWDSTLAYLPYHPLRTKMIQYMHDEKISIAETGSPFPNHGQFRYLDLSNSHESFAILDLKTNQYVFYSNVYNDFTDEELSELKNRWTIVKEYRSMQVRVTLYKRP